MTDSEPLDFDWVLVPPEERASRLPELIERGGLALELVRRGCDHGVLVVGDVPPAPTGDPAAAWRAARPVFLPDLLTERVGTFADEIQASRETFDRLRDGARLLDELEPRLEDAEPFVYAGSTVDQADEREIERVFVDIPGQGKPNPRRRVRDLTARLSWIANDESDLSLRIRFSFGHESTRDWLAPDERAEHSDQLAAAVFPECAVLAEGLVPELLESLHGAPLRMSERIIYDNVPGGGAVFHHDADPGQRGVAFVQLGGVTVWLALPVDELAEQVAAFVAERGHGLEGTDESSAAIRAHLLAAPDPLPEWLWQLLNFEPAFTARLSAAGHLYALGPGDALLLPSHRPELCAWHSVFGTGDGPGLAHSFGLFDARSSSGRTEHECSIAPAPPAPPARSEEG